MFYCGFKIGRTITEKNLSKFFHSEVEKEIKKYLENDHKEN